MEQQFENKEKKKEMLDARQRCQPSVAGLPVSRRLGGGLVLWRRGCLVRCGLGGSGSGAQGSGLIIAGLYRAVGPSVVGRRTGEAEPLCLGLGSLGSPCCGARAGGQVHRRWTCPVGVCRGALGEGDDGGDGLGGGFGGGDEGVLSSGVVRLPLSVVYVDAVEQAGDLCEGLWEGFEAVAEDIADFLAAVHAEEVDEGGVVPLDIGLEAGELGEVHCKLVLALLQAVEGP